MPGSTKKLGTNLFNPLMKKSLKLKSIKRKDHKYAAIIIIRDLVAFSIPKIMEIAHTKLAGVKIAARYMNRAINNACFSSLIIPDKYGNNVQMPIDNNKRAKDILESLVLFFAYTKKLKERQIKEAIKEE